MSARPTQAVDTTTYRNTYGLKLRQADRTLKIVSITSVSTDSAVDDTADDDADDDGDGDDDEENDDDEGDTSINCCRKFA